MREAGKKMCLIKQEVMNIIKTLVYQDGNIIKQQNVYMFNLHNNKINTKNLCNLGWTTIPIKHCSHGNYDFDGD